MELIAGLIFIFGLVVMGHIAFYGLIGLGVIEDKPEEPHYY